MSVFHLVYRSNASPDCADTDIKAILDGARSFNRSNELSGILIYRKRSFIQLLEGDREVVISLYKKIQKDRRHERVVTLIETMSEDRIFSNWSMAFVDDNVGAASVEAIWSLFDSVLQGSPNDKNVILPILKKFLGVLAPTTQNI